MGTILWVVEMGMAAILWVVAPHEEGHANDNSRPWAD